ncbi:MAG: acetoacetate decarboxylase family protein [Chloroflexota bacterium]
MIIPESKNPIQSSIRSYLGDSFSMPALSPELAPPPYHYKDDHMLNILFKTDPALVEKWVPLPLKPDPSLPILFYVGKLTIANYGLSYNEAALAVPVLDSSGKQGFYPLVLYLDQTNPIIGGRETYGYPKKEAEKITFEEQNGMLSGGITRYGFPIITYKFETLQKVSPIPPRVVAPWYLLKFIPSAEKDAPPDVLKLITMDFEPYTVRELTVGKGTLEFGNSPYDALLSKIPVTEILYSELIVSDFSMDYAKVVHDYLAGGAV